VRGEVVKYDEALDVLLDEMAMKLPALREIIGVLDSSPSAEWDAKGIDDDNDELTDDHESEDGDVGWLKA